MQSSRQLLIKDLPKYDHAMTSINHNEIIQDTLKTIEEMNLLNRSDDEEISIEMGE